MLIKLIMMVQTWYRARSTEMSMASRLSRDLQQPLNHLYLLLPGLQTSFSQSLLGCHTADMIIKCKPENRTSVSTSTLLFKRHK